MRVFINGKFLNAPQSGVQRVARELTKAIDLLPLSDATSDLIDQFVLSGPSIDEKNTAEFRMPIKSFSKLPSILWEQIYFPYETRRDFALNFCNTGSPFSSQAITLIHDAQVYISPQSYSFAFRLWYRFLLPFLGRRNAHIITVSNYSKDQLVKFGVAPADKISVVHNGSDHILNCASDPGLLASLDLTPRKFAVALANTQSHKNVRILIEAFFDHDLADLKLVLFGGATREAFEGILGRALPGNVVFTGRISDAEMRGLLENALCFCFPSTTEGFGLPVVEAMQLGCPIIAAPCGALPEVCGEAAIYAAPDTPSDWAKAVLYLDKDPSNWLKLSEDGKSRGQLFTWEKAASKIVELVKRFRPHA